MHSGNNIQSIPKQRQGMHQSHRLRGWTFTPYESGEERLITSAVGSIKHMCDSRNWYHLGWVARVSQFVYGLVNKQIHGPFEDFQKLIYQTYFALVLEHPKDCLAMPSGHLCATRGLPSRHLSIAIDSLTQINLLVLAASFCDKKPQPTSNKNCSGTSQTKLQTSIPCGRGIWCMTHGNPHEGKHDTSTCSFTLDNRPARCSFMLQVCNLCILRNRYSRFRPVRILLHCTRLNTEHLSGALLTLEDTTTTTSSLAKRGSRFWNAEQSTTKAFFGGSTTPEYSKPLFSKVTNKECAAVSWNIAIQGLSQDQTCHPRPSGGQASPVATNQSCASKKHKHNLDQSGDTRKSVTCCKSDESC